MRDFLTGIAIILIVVLTTVLVAPYFVDWNGQREFLEARLSHALGQKVTVGGTIDLKLLPTPYLVLDQVVVGGDEAPIKIGVRHLNLELAVAPLLHGEFDIVEARLREPTIRIGLEADHTLPLLPAAPAFAADIRFDRIRVSDGTLAISDPESGRTFVLDHLDLDAEAGSFAGPFKVSGTEGAAERRTSFRITTAAPKNGRTHARLVVDETATHAGADFDGALIMRAAGDATRQSLDGKLVVASHVSRGEREPVAWKLSGLLQANPTQGRLDGGELRVGSDDVGLTFETDAQAGFGPGAKAAINLKAKQLDIDRLGGLPTEGTRTPPQLPDLSELRSVLAATRPPIPTEFNLSIDAATYAGETLNGIAARFTVGDGGTHAVNFAIDGPGGAHVAADGTLTAGATPWFAGTLDASADDLPRTIDWARRIAPAVSWSGTDVGVTKVKLAGPVTLNANEVSSTGLSVEVDRTKLAGKIRLSFGAEQTPKLAADLTSDALDLESLPSLARLRDDTALADFELRLDARALKVSRFGEGALDAGRIRVNVEKTGERIALKDVRLDGLGGASLVATGEVAPSGGRLSLDLDAKRLEAATGLVRQLWPSAATTALVARASSLAPAQLKIEATLADGTSATPTANRLSVVGNLGATKINASADPDPGHAGETAISAALDTPEATVLLRQLGFNTVPIQTVGASRLVLSGRGRVGDPIDTKVDLSLGTTKAELTGRFALTSDAPEGSGRLKMQSPDLTPLLQTLAIAFPDLTGRIPADMSGQLTLKDGNLEASSLTGQVAGVATQGSLQWRQAPADAVPLTGALEFDRLRLSGLVGLALGHEQTTSGDAAWSRQPFAVGLVDPPRAALSLKSKLLDVVPGVQATNASFDLAIAPNQVSVRKLTADLWSGRMKGDAALRRDGRQASVEGHLALDKVAIHLPDTLDTHLTAKLDFAGGGTSPFGLLSSLAGSGEASVDGLRFAGADPKALVRIFDDVEADALPVDQDAIVHAYNEASGAPLEIGKGSFGLGLASGVLRFDAIASDEVGPTTSKVGGSLDLPRLRLAVRVEEALKTLPKNWSGPPPTIAILLDEPLTTGKPLGKPSRSVDVSGFVNTVAARALARETARIEAYELDIRERAFFNARLQSERRREEERQKAEDDAKKAEADRKARIEAARQDRLRKEQAARAAHDADEKARQDEKPPDDNTAPHDPQSPPPDGAKDPASLGRY